jgi:SAM-dependent MidA family methyltransferase
LGDLAAEAIDSAGPLCQALHWRFIEPFERVQGWQRRRLGGVADAAEWATVLGEPAVVGCLLANEVLDAFPVHVLEVASGGEARELYVDLDGSRFMERLGPLSLSNLADPARRAAVHLDEGARFEVCLELEGWFDQASRDLQRGFLLIIDYGNVEPDLWLESRSGSLASPGPADLGTSPLEEPGRKDITARVNFSAAIRAAQRAGFCPQPLVTQRAWLQGLGLATVADEIDLARLYASLGGWIEEAVDLAEELAHLLELTAKGELGDLLVLRAGKGVTPP